MTELYQCAHARQAPVELIERLHESQAGVGRHKCPVCAYALGGVAINADTTARHRGLEIESCAHGASAPAFVLAALPEYQGGPGRHKCTVCAYEQGLSSIIAVAPVYPDEVAPDGVYPEGAVRQVTVDAYERNPEARRRCIEHYGYGCSVCGLTFESQYGPVGRQFIHVHHLRSLSEIRAEFNVDPVHDLRPVCPNCHAMIHRRAPPYRIEELQAMLRKH